MHYLSLLEKWEVNQSTKRQKLLSWSKKKLNQALGIVIS